MPLFILDVLTDPAARRVVLRLADGDGRHLAAHEVDLGAVPPTRWAAAFDTRGHMRRMARQTAPDQPLDELGGFLGADVLGRDIAGRLTDGVGARTLVVRVPDAPQDPLAAGFARIPWELSRAPGDTRTLREHAVSVRVAFAGADPGKSSTVAPRGEAVRVLLVFADPPAARPLAARLERERLRDLFFGEVLPKRNVEVDVLCHGVTRARLRERIAERGGYHIVHWSGHGRLNALDTADGTMTGEDLVALFRDAGGRVPEVVMLSACHSGALGAPKDWAALRAEDGEKGEGEAGGEEGLAGTALALLHAHVKQVVAMRWAVGDAYARRLARRFYRHLLADEGQHEVDTALALARGELLRDDVRKGEHKAIDHATPMVLGAEAVRFAPEKKRSRQMDRREPRPQPLLTSGSRELDPPWGFVGRGEELGRLFQEWMERGGEKKIALLQGLAGIGKTSLAAEVVNLAYERFAYVLAFQAKGAPLGIEEMYRRVDQRLAQASPAYRDKCSENERVRVFVDVEPGFKGAERYETLAYNLVDAMGAEPILLVLDNFETNLVTGARGYACADPAWERLFEILCERLGATGSRVMVTSRHKPAVLEGKALWIPLGALPVGEAKLYFQNHPVLRALWYEHAALARRILDVSRGHALILARIADLARLHYDKTGGLAPAGRDALESALDRIQGEGFKMLPDLFANVKGDAEREREHKYLNDVAVGAVDLLIDRLMPEARRLLWIVTRAGEPAPEALLEKEWGSSPTMLLGVLCGTGLLTRENTTYAFHELVAERATEWMKSHPADRGEKTEAEVWTAYGEWYGRTFEALLASRKPGSRDVAVEMGRRGIRYLVRARAYESIGPFASAVVTTTIDQTLLGQVIADLRGATADAPAGQIRWKLRTSLADALQHAGHPEQALPLYTLAAAEAEVAGDAEAGRIYGRKALALANVSRLEEAREAYLQSKEALRRTSAPRLFIVGTELQVMLIDAMQGRAAEVMVTMEERLAELRSWRARKLQGESVPEAPDDEGLLRHLMSGLDIARHAYLRAERWQSSLDLVAEKEQLLRDSGASEQEIARARFNRYYPLTRLDKANEARAVLDGCLDVFRRMGDLTWEASTLGALAQVWGDLGDVHHALALARQSLALHERLPNVEDRAVSHDNLAELLDATGASGEARTHQLADLAYRLASSFDVRPSVPHLTDCIGKSIARGEHFDLPRLAALLADPAFAPLGAFLQDRGADLTALQTRIDALVEHIRLQERLRLSGLTPTSTGELPSATNPRSPRLIFAEPSALLREHFDLASEVLVLSAPGNAIQPDDIKRVEALFADNRRVDPGFVLAITAEPDAEKRLDRLLPDDRRYLFVDAAAFQAAADPQAFLHDLLRDGLGRRRLFDMEFPVTDWQFFGRGKELESLERDVLTGHCVGVFGLRKVGKTSLLRRLAAKLRGGPGSIGRVLPVEVNLLHLGVPRSNLKGVAELIGEALEQEAKRAGVSLPASPSDPLERLRVTVEHVERAHGARVLLILDEYEILLGVRLLPRSDGLELLTWLRGMAQQHPRTFGFMIAGRNQQLIAPARIDGGDNPMYRFLRSFPIAGLEPDDCRGMIQKLGGSMGLRFEPEALDPFVEETGGHPRLARVLGDLVDAGVPMEKRGPFTVDAAQMKQILPRFARTVDEDMRELVAAATDIDPRADNYLAHLAFGVPWIGGPAEGRIDDALVDYGILHPDTHAFRIGRLRAWLRQNYVSPVKVAHG